MTMMAGTALAVGCGGSDGDDDDDDGGNVTATTSPGFTASDTVTSNTQAATTLNTSSTVTSTGTGTTGTTTGTNTGTTTGTTGDAGGAGGGGGANCEDDEPMVSTTGGGGEGGAAGASSGGEISDGWNFVESDETEAWSIVDCADDATDCVDGDNATVGWACGFTSVTINWTADANTAAQKFQLQNVVGEDMLRDLTGKTIYARIRMISAAVEGHGYDFNVIAQDFIPDSDDTNDWKWFSTCYNGEGDCPNNPTGEAFGPDAWVPLQLPMRAALAPEGFAFDSVRKFAIEIATKHWADGEPFNYESGPTTFEIDYFVW
jgi:hypothetical protein